MRNIGWEQKDIALLNLNILELTIKNHYKERRKEEEEKSGTFRSQKRPATDECNL
jgi:hypothetical protein